MLTGPTYPPASGETKKLVVFLHGYGANGQDLIGLAEPLASILQDTLFLSPDAPEPCVGTPLGRQWFPIPWLDGSSQEDMTKSFLSSMTKLNTWLDAQIETHNVEPGDVAFLGFSQGTMLGLHVGLRREKALAGIVGFSGRLLMPDQLAAEIKTRPPVLLVHGEMDPVVPFDSMAEAETALKASNVPVETLARPGLQHGIDPEGLSTAAAFLNTVLNAPH